MVTHTDNPTKPLTDNELLMGLEALARRRWYEQWESGMNVLVTFAHCDLVPGCDEFCGNHRIIVEYRPSGEKRYYYRPGPFTMPVRIEDRDTALYAIREFRPDSERERIPAFLANDDALLEMVRS
jgi:hypothetical protein